MIDIFSSLPKKRTRSIISKSTTALLNTIDCTVNYFCLMASRYEGRWECGAGVDGWPTSTYTNYTKQNCDKISGYQNQKNCISCFKNIMVSCLESLYVNIAKLLDTFHWSQILRVLLIYHVLNISFKYHEQINQESGCRTASQ